MSDIAFSKSLKIVPSAHLAMLNHQFNNLICVYYYGVRTSSTLLVIFIRPILTIWDSVADLSLNETSPAAIFWVVIAEKLSGFAKG